MRARALSAILIFALFAVLQTAPASAQSGKTVVEGTVTSINTDGTFFVSTVYGTQRVSMQQFTRVRNVGGNRWTNDNVLGVGDVVRVRGYRLNDGTLVATRVAIRNDNSTALGYTSYTPQSWPWQQILGSIILPRILGASTPTYGYVPPNNYPYNNPSYSYTGNTTINLSGRVVATDWGSISVVSSNGYSGSVFMAQPGFTRWR